MSTKNLSRRTAVQGAALGLLGAGSGPLHAGAHSNPIDLDLDLNDPVVRARVRAKISGSTEPATVHGLAQLHIHAYLNDGNLQAVITLWNYTVTKWAPISETEFSMLHFESGVYSNYNTEDVLDDVWNNPITGEQRKVWPFVGGPIKGTLGPDGLRTGPNATVKPQSMGIHIIGPQVYVPSRSTFKFPSPFSAEKWPKESSGPLFHWDLFSAQSALLADVANPALASVPSSHQYQNLKNWHPWMGMGGVEGRSLGNAYGNKLMGGFEELPAFLQAAIKEQTPEIMNTDDWSEVRNDFADYMKARKPT